MTMPTDPTDPTRQPLEPSAAHYIEQLKAHQSSAEIKRLHQDFKTGQGQIAQDVSFMGVPMAQVNAVSKAFQDMQPQELEKLLESPLHEVRTGALRIMVRQATAQKTPRPQRKQLLILYLKRHDQINHPELVDNSAPEIIGRYLVDQPRDLLYELARSQDPWKRRTAIIATQYLIQQGDVQDTFQIAEKLLGDDEPQIHEAVGRMLRKAGKKEPAHLGRFLDAHAATMPHAMLERAIDLCDKKTQTHYRGLKKAKQNTQ